MESGLVPMIIVLALGAGTLGGPDALRPLIDLAGRNPVLDIATCLLLIGVLTAPLLGVVLLVRFVREPLAQAQPRGPRDRGAPRRPRAPAADCLLARMTLTVSLGVAFSVAACLVAASDFGGLVSSARLAFDFAWKTPVVVSAAGVLLLLVLCFTPLLRVPRAAGARARAVCLAGICVLLVTPPPARGALDALRHSSAGSTSAFAGVAAACAVLGTALLTRNFRNGAAAPATGTARFGRTTAQVTSTAAACFVGSAACSGSG